MSSNFVMLSGETIHSKKIQALSIIILENISLETMDQQVMQFYRLLLYHLLLGLRCSANPACPLATTAVPIAMDLVCRSRIKISDKINGPWVLRGVYKFPKKQKHYSVLDNRYMWSRIRGFLQNYPAWARLESTSQNASVHR